MNCLKNSSSGFYFGLGVFSQPPFSILFLIPIIKIVLSFNIIFFLLFTLYFTNIIIILVILNVIFYLNIMHI